MFLLLLTHDDLINKKTILNRKYKKKKTETKFNVRHLALKFMQIVFKHF